MTTIQSTAIGGMRELDIIVRSDHLVNLAILGGLSIQIPTADLLAALNAVPAAELEGARSVAVQQKQRAEAAEADRDEARNWAETLQRQKFDAEEKLGELRSILGHTSYKLQQAEAKLAEAEADAGRWGDELVEAQDAADSWESRAKHTESVIGNYLRRIEELTAERDALAATIERVRTEAKKWGVHYRWAADKLLAALEPEPAFVLPTEAGAEFWAMGPNEDYWTSFVTFTDGSRVLYIEQETSETVSLWPHELRERYDQFKPIEAMRETAPGIATEEGAE